MNHLYQYFINCFSIDYRSLALYRVILGILVLADLFNRFPYITAHYTDWGLLPRTTLLNNFNSADIFNLYAANGSYLWSCFLFVVTCLFCFLLIIGYKTKLASIAVWFLVMNLQQRNPLLLQGGDDLLRMMLFWSMFLPLGSSISIDQFQKTKILYYKKSYLSLATFACLLQFFLLYIFTGLLKSGTEWLITGDAIYYALHIDHFSRPLALWLRNYYELLRPMTFAIWNVEVYGTFLLVSPVFFKQFRVIGVIIFISIQVGFHLNMKLGLFPFISAAAVIPFIPSYVWEYLKYKFKRMTYILKSAIYQIICFCSTKLPTRVLNFSLNFCPKVLLANKFLFLTTLFFAIITSIWSNISGLENSKYPMPSQLSKFGSLLKIHQNWSMFAPYPMKDDGWYVMPGRLKDGSFYDVFRQKIGAPNFEKPSLVSQDYPSQRWRKYMVNLWLKKNSQFRPDYARYLCRKTNKKSKKIGDKLDYFEIIYMKEFTPNPGQPFPEIERVSLWKHNCFINQNHSKTVISDDIPQVIPQYNGYEVP